MGRYWNGYKWCEDPPMMHLEPKPIEQHEREALAEAELNPPEVTGEHEPLAEFDVSDVPVPEESVPNMIGKVQQVSSFKEFVDKMLRDGEPVITDEVRERIRKELASKGDGGSK